ncbi:MAG: hypothetical protein Q4D77_07325 [Peptostreptococcaceae bacterium]|nr:hypothetical protein [Peptostreptococcaceae bacterium]
MVLRRGFGLKLLSEKVTALVMKIGRSLNTFTGKSALQVLSDRIQSCRSTHKT